MPMEGLDERKPISLHFGPFNAPSAQHAIFKDADGGKKRRYLCGVATGPKPDQHGERVSDNCVAKMVAQAQAGDVLLFPDLHGKGDSNDIGILENFKVLPGGEWYVEFRLYDEDDGVSAEKLATIESIWKQMLGLPPYRKPRKKGFSIEGYIPSQSGLLKRETYGVIDDIVLEGAIITPIPAYQDSVAHAVYKALDEKPPYMISKDLRGKLQAAMADRETRDAYERERWNVQGALDDMVQETMKGTDPDKRAALTMAFDEYRDLMVELVLNSAAIFQEDVAKDAASDEASPYSAGPSKSVLFEKLRADLDRLAAIMKEKGNG